MKTDALKSIGDQALAELRATGQAFYAQLTADQIPIVEKATRELAELGVELLLNPERSQDTQKEIAFVQSTLTSEAALTALRAEHQTIDAVRRVFTRAISALIVAAV
jgi:hypothetical protein